MSRFQTSRIILVNWLGYPFETFGFRQGPIVQLHGPNGAGKTTVMVAATAPLMPDKRRLEQALRAGAHDEKGLVARVALGGSPSYSVLELATPVGPLYAGVQFVSSAGDVALHPFIVEGLPNGLAPADWLLRSDGDRQVFATLAEIEQNVLLRGGTLRKKPIQEYLDLLYERGVLPRRLRDAKEKDLFWNTFMISFGVPAHEVLGRLKDYLLPPETRLRGSLELMDEAYRNMLAARQQIDHYTAQQEALQEFWGLATTTVKLASAYAFRRLTNLRTRFDTRWHELAEIHTAIRIAAIKQAEAEVAAEQLREDCAGLTRQVDERVGEIALTISELRRQAKDAESRAASKQALEALRRIAGLLISSPRDVEAARNIVAAKRDGLVAELSTLGGQLDRLDAELSALRAGEWPGLDEVAAVAAAVGGTPIPNHPAFSELDPSLAAAVEASLGPAVYGIVHADPREAARQTSKLTARPDHLWFLDAQAADRPERLLGEAAENAIVVLGNPIVRTSTYPTIPMLGATARTALLASKTEERRQKADRARELDGERTKLDTLMDQTAGLPSADQSLFEVAEIPDAQHLVWIADAAEKMFKQIKATAAARIDLDGLPVDIGGALSALQDGKLRVDDLNRKISDACTSAERQRSQVKSNAQKREPLVRELWALRKERPQFRRDTDAWLAERARDKLLAVAGDPGEIAITERDYSSVERLREAAQAAAHELTALAGRHQAIHGVAEKFSIDLKDHCRACQDLAASPLLALWRACKRIANQFMPHDIEQTEDPGHALAIFSEQLTRLRGEVMRAELVYRNQTDHVVTNIHSAIRSHQHRIQRLSEEHTGGAFGNFDNVRLRVEVNTAMVDLLIDIMSRLALFMKESDATFQDALGRVVQAVERQRKIKLVNPTEALIDYRTYADLKVDILRRGEDDWTPLEKSGASNGERIGITFIALFMVLDDWELRDIDGSGAPRRTSVRQLVLDEATQIDDKGLETLANFAEATGSRIIMAAPQEVAVKGRSTVYTLMRVIEKGGPRVVVSVVNRGRELDTGADGAEAS